MKTTLLAAATCLALGSVANAGGITCTRTWNTVNCQDSVMGLRVNPTPQVSGEAIASIFGSLAQISQQRQQQAQGQWYIKSGGHLFPVADLDADILPLQAAQRSCGKTADTRYFKCMARRGYAWKYY